ncbi:MAG: PilZ domain-containing protein [Sphingobium sp.]
MKAREARQRVAFNVRIRRDSGWIDANIRNMSSRGLMLEIKNPPAKGSFVELRRGSVVIVGQVRWTDGNCCGVRTQDRISAGQLKTAYDNCGPAKATEAVGVDRRAAVRVLTPQEVAERSRMQSMLFQRVVLIAGVACGAVFVISLAFELLNVPMETIRLHLK